MHMPPWLIWIFAAGVMSFGAYRLYAFPKSTWVNMRVFLFGLQLWMILAVLKLIRLHYTGEV